MQSKIIKISLLKNNSGQIQGLPKNPRLLKDDSFIKLKKSLQDDPEMLELREVIAYDDDGDLVVICGNMRLKALKDLGIKEVPVKILPKETSIEKLKAYTIKDNIGFGDHDWGVLRADWDVEELALWGLDVPDFVDDEADKEDDNNEEKFYDSNEPHQEVQQTNMIAISLTDEEYKLWFNSKEKLKINNDKKALFELIKKFENESSIN